MQSLTKMFQYVKPYTVFAILAPLMMAVEVAMDLVQPMLMQRMIDVGIANDDHAYAIKLGLLMMLSALIGLIGGAGSTIYSTKAAVNFAADLRRDVFKKTQKFSSESMDAFGAGKLITIVTNDISSVQQAVMMMLRVFIRGPLLFIGAIGFVWFTARPLFPVLFVAVPVLMALIYYFSSRSGKLFAKVQQAMDQVNTKLQETFAGIRVIKAFNRQAHEIEAFQNVNDALTERSLSAEQVILTLMPMMLFVVNLGVVAGMWMGAIKVNEGTLQVGVILAFINYLNIMMNGLITSSHVLTQITRSFTSAHRIAEVLNTERRIKGAETSSKYPDIRGEIEFRNVSFRYHKNGAYALQNISFRAKAGETIGIIGSTGSGKSTLVHLIPRLYDPDSGEILIDGVNIKHYALEPLREAIGFVPQKAMLFSGTIEENLRFGKVDASLVELKEAADAAVASEFIAKLDGAFSYPLTQGATNLSGGQKQRLSMARAFIRQPKIFVFDDSTSAIDAISEASVQRVLKERYPNTTKFIISSKISSMIDADQIVVLDQGRVEARGTHEQLLAQSDVYRKIYETQSGRGVLLYE